MLHMSAPTLYPIEPAEVRRRWPTYMRTGVAEALRHANDGIMPEDVFASIMAGQSLAYMSFHGDQLTNGPAGFVIVRTYETAEGREMLMWIGYHNGENDRVADYAPQFKSIARELGCNRVTLESTRPGWHRAVPGMTLARYTYHLEVDGE